MDLLKPIKGAIKKVQQHQEQRTSERQAQEKLEQWKHRLSDAMSHHDTFRHMAAVWDSIYHGTKAVGPKIGKVYMSDRHTDGGQTNDARQVVNIALQLIESQIDISVPLPAVEAIEGDDDSERKQMIEGMLTYMASGTQLERIVSLNERIVRKNSMAYLKVCYNPDYATHKWRGRIETTNPHPTNIIPQPGVYKVEDMDYLFHIENRTIDYICREYGEEFREELEGENAEYGYLEQFSDSSNSNEEKGRISVVEAWYKDNDGDVGVITWANDTLLRDIPKFFYKRDADGNIMEYEDIEIESADEFGNPVMQVVQVRCHVPKRFPFVIQYNIPREKSFYGKSDIDIIYDQQEAIKKVLSIEEEKLVKGTTKILVRKGSDIANKITNATLQILEVDDPVKDIKVVDIKTPDNSLENYYAIILQAAKDALGVTEASQGRAEGTSLSGKALEMLAQNTAGRLAPKIFEKNMAFTELYRLYYDFILAFYDERRPYRIEGKDSKAEYGYFDKSKLVKQDASGEWYYPEFDIYITTDTGLPKEKSFIMDFAVKAGNRMDNVQFWSTLESIGFPLASKFVEMEQQKQQMAEQMAMQEQQQGIDQLISQLSPDEQQAFISAPPEEQQAIIQELMGGTM